MAALPRCAANSSRSRASSAALAYATSTSMFTNLSVGVGAGAGAAAVASTSGSWRWISHHSLAFSAGSDIVWWALGAGGGGAVCRVRCASPSFSFLSFFFFFFFFGSRFFLFVERTSLFHPSIKISLTTFACQLFHNLIAASHSVALGVSTAKMNRLTISYGLQSAQSQSRTHILPITKVLYPKCIAQCPYYLTSARDGSIIVHSVESSAELQNVRLQVHSDWISDLVELSVGVFVSVSHDFSVTLINVDMSPRGGISASSRIVGDHDDYIKACSVLDSSRFVTAGLDGVVKVWGVSTTDTHVHLSHQFDNKNASIYALATGGGGPLDIVVGDSNGDISLYSSRDAAEPVHIPNAHDTNVKCIVHWANGTFVSASADGVVKVWRGDPVRGLVPLETIQRPCSIWCLRAGPSDKETLLMGDSAGGVTALDMRDYSLETLLPQSSSGEKKSGVLALEVIAGELHFSKCNDSNLCALNFESGVVRVVCPGEGVALTKSSLLTNRRHVITENTVGSVQRWDIISCELVDTFPHEEGSFDEIVRKYTTKEILSHWCTVSVKVGMLFVKINPKFLDTEVYGSALHRYNIINGVELNEETRYNLGKIVANSLFYDFVRWEVKRDAKFREKLSHSKHKQTQAFASVPAQAQSEEPPAFNKQKEKFKRRSAFAKFGYGSSNSNLGTKSDTGSPYVSAPTTPLNTDFQSVPLKEGGLSGGYHMNVSTDSVVQPAPKTSSSLLTRKFKSFRSGSAKDSGISQSATPEDPRPHTTPAGAPVAAPLSMAGTSAVPENALHDALHTLAENNKSLEQATAKNQENPPLTVNTNLLPAPADTKQMAQSSQRSEFISDYIEQVHDDYMDQYHNASTSMKLLSKRTPETKIIRDSRLPIIQVKSAPLILIHCWKDGACGGRVLFSTLLPPTKIKNHHLNRHPSSTSLHSKASHTSATSLMSLSSSFSSSTTSLSSISSGKQKSSTPTSTSTASLGHLDEQPTTEEVTTAGKKKTFEDLERNLPYWLAETLFNDIRVLDDKQPKLNFIIVPWVNPNANPTGNSGTAETPGEEESSSQQFSHMFKLGKSKSNDMKLGRTDLPKISEANIKLTAPGMIKVKKIKYYVVDRFEAKTPEMKGKLEPVVWLELLCKGQVLDDDMTLSTVRTLHWKSQGEIVIEYRRKVAVDS
ncbi:Duf1p KNAG_0K00850 [Huiozyma naganishii CBS 8797]|uniref:Uncharacterized protein n=1 Tax=Huiozyma naganishii (strain ATCC MYA-139 / BCRC 22969 / CBS 8797 / KCTC 17520 / NBRC 10181 / NCYC 3082 / Yp74L-3) TaxID=1071383 RepID=J7SAS8_HUIN7|nr:hypothetical protein KNAG_0K00850 [Kazachstania naganishii CBS 8797]CCK72451.1 hypothetical protein KNAG_0K00850 [Kazachstania naganishii CBS 8797]